MKSMQLRGSLSFLLMCLLLLSLPYRAAAEDPEIRDRKGVVPAESTQLDRESYADGSIYENPPTQVKTVRIGLCYGETAADEVELLNTIGAGFRIGVYDEDRSFVERGRTEHDRLLIQWAAHEENGLMILGGDEEEILYLSREEDTLAVEPIAGETWYLDNSYCGGFECRKAEPGLMILINFVDLETYVKGVLPYEMANDWPMEALKAQAVCARTYVVYNQDRYEEFGFDLTDNTESQVYCGTTKATAWTDAAVDATAGELIRYEGEICEIYYFAADGGATEDGIHVFGTDRPYLVGKRDPFERAMHFGYRSWRVTRTGEEIQERLARKEIRTGVIRSLKPEYSAMGNVIAITFVDENGEHVRIEGRRCYTLLGLPDCIFSVAEDEENGFVFAGSGLGHSCGMSQWGARAMDEVYGYTYDDIIRFYFTGAYIA